MASRIYVRHDARCSRACADILEQFLALRAEDFERRSHLVDGRYENLYPRPGAVPALEPVLDTARRIGARILGCEPKSLRLGWWFNAMAPGTATAVHSHDEGDERLSGVYYVSAPPGSGRLRLRVEDRWCEITPRAGRFVFFDPAVVHEVTRNDSGDLRLSVGMNVGPDQES